MSRTAELQPLQQLALQLMTLKLGAVKRFGDFVMVPLCRARPPDSDYCLLSKAISQGTSSVTEVSVIGVVHEATLTNNSDQPILVLDGEELVGAKQNRITNFTTLAPPRTTMRVSVSCIEQGRWRWASPSLITSGAMLYPSARVSNMRYVQTHNGVLQSDPISQLEIWDSIESKSRQLGLTTPVRSLEDLYRPFDCKLKRLEQAMTASTLQVGAAFFRRRQLIGLELLRSPMTFEKQLPRLVRSYSMEILDDRMSTANVDYRPSPSPTFKDHNDNSDTGFYLDAVTRFFSSLVKSSSKKSSNRGMGYHLQSKTNNGFVTALFLDDSLIHLSALSLPAH